MIRDQSIVVQIRCPQLRAVDPRPRRHQANHDLARGHFQGEHRDRPGLRRHHNMVDDAGRESRFADAGTGCEHHEVAGMEAGRECVQVGKSGLDSHGSRPLLVRVQVFREISDHVLHGPGALKVSPLRRLRDFQDSPFGFVEYFVRRPPLRTECDLRDLGARPDETAKHRTFADDLRVRDDVRGVGGVLGEVREVGEPPDDSSNPSRASRSATVTASHGCPSSHRLATAPNTARWSLR